MTTIPLDETQARFERGDEALDAYGEGRGASSTAIVRMAGSIADVPKLVAALRAVEAVHVRTCEVNGEPCDTGERYSVAICGPCGESWPCPTITAIREALNG